MKIFLLILGFLLLFSWSNYPRAMVSDGIHNTQDYVNLAQSEKAYEVACAVTDKRTGINQSGVLISPNIVATAAHGIVHVLQKNNISSNDEMLEIPTNGLFVTFTQPYRLTVEVSHVVIIPQYISKALGKEAKYDIAFLKLKSSIKHINPPHFYETTKMDTSMPAYVVTHGTLGLPDHNSTVARAFALLEFDHMYIHGLDEDTLAIDKPIMLSSIFLDPDSQRHPLDDDEFKERNAIALDQWKKYSKPPTGLALYGSSGAPVFAYVKVGKKKKLNLVGIITSFSPINTSFLTKKQQRDPSFLLRNSKQVRGNFQSIFALFYVEDTTKNKENLISLKKSRFMQQIIQKIR